MKADPKQTYVAAQWKYGAPLIACRFDPKSRFLFTTSEDFTIQRWNLEDGKSVSFGDFDSWAFSLAVSLDGETLISGGGDGHLIWWPASVENPQPIRTVDAHPGHNNWIRALAVSPDGKLLASGGNDGVVKLWNMADASPVRELIGHRDEDFNNIYSLLFHPAGKYLLSGDLQGKVIQWETETGKKVREFDAKALHSYNRGQRVNYGGVRSLAISPDGKFLVAGGLHKGTNPLGAVNEPLVLRFEWNSQKIMHSHTASGVRGVIWRCLFHPDGHLIAASGGSGGGFLIFWADKDVKEVHKLKLPNTARDMDLHPDGLQLATIHHDRQVRISRMAGKK